MRLQNTSFAYNVTVNGTGQCDWSTEIGQGVKHTFSYAGFPEIINAMVYYKIPDPENINIRLGKGQKSLKPFSEYPDKELVLASLFTKVYINDHFLEGCNFLMCIIKETNQLNGKGEINKHCGRCNLKFRDDTTYRGEPVNKKTIHAITDYFRTTDKGSWVVLDMQIVNEDELRLYGFPLGSVAKDYSSIDSRNQDYDSRLKHIALQYKITEGDALSKKDLGHILESMYYNEKVYQKKSAIIDFAVKYGKYIVGTYSAAEIINETSLANSYHTELSVALDYYKKVSHSPAIMYSYDDKKPLQQIYFGAPGTSKSNTIKMQTEGRDVYRITFHPDTDYSNFVGCYKPTKEKDSDGNPTGKITYDFTPQVFTDAYVKAWEKICDSSATDKAVFLIIEEINRGNCAQIFGDIFQSLDRNKDGYSDYDVTPDHDLADYLHNAFENVDIPDPKVRSGEKLVLPPNLHIWATMNTSDQSLFPIDSAFKRRWDWKYMPIKDEGKLFKIKVGNGEVYDWWQFIVAINERITKVTESEDKQLGYWFCLPDDDKTISLERFVSKVIFYLWIDVFKDFADSSQSPFLIKEANSDKKRKVTFKDFYDENGNPIASMVKDFMCGLGFDGPENEPLPDMAGEPTEGTDDEEGDDTYNVTAEDQHEIDDFNEGFEGSESDGEGIMAGVKKRLSGDK